MKKFFTIVIASIFLFGSTNAFANTFFDNSTTNKGGNAYAVGIGVGIAEIEKGAVTVDPKFYNTDYNLNLVSSQNDQLQGQGQQQSTSNSNNAAQSVVFKSAKTLPGLTTASTEGPRNPEIQTNDIITARMLISADNEIRTTLGQGMMLTKRHHENGCTAVVSYGDKVCSVRVFPSGSANGITPALLETAAYHAAAKIGMKLNALTGYYATIENKSKGFGAGVSNSGSMANADRGIIGGIAAAVTGNSGSTRQIIRFELFYTGEK